MPPLLIRVLAVVLLVWGLWKLFRFAMALRFAKVLREEERQAHEATGRRLVAEVPTHAGDLVLFHESPSSFFYGEREIEKHGIVAARLFLNGRIVEQSFRPGALAPDASWAEEYDGRERWDLRLDFTSGEPLAIPCGMLREGVSREAATRLFRAVATSIGGTTASQGGTTQSSAGKPSSG
jgi:hypothetical protein